jgi:large subunit ribosomal protein L1
MPFERLICHVDSEAALKKANLGRVLGPKGLMPSLRTKTITNDIRALMADLVGASEYRERIGVVRLAIGQLGFSPQMLSDNVKTMLAQVKQDITEAEAKGGDKRLDDVVISSTNGPGFSLSGTFSSTDETLKPEHLQSVM